MRELFIIDKKNYKENGTVGKRPSVRGIIIKEGKVAMMHSLKYDYYKLPGGGMDVGESYEETLIREVREESGLIVKPDTIKEFGYVRRIEKGRFEDIFVQENYYYLCDVEKDIVEQNLDDYEADEQFTLEFVTIDDAIRVNQNAEHKEKSEISTFEGMLERENRVLELVQKEMIGELKYVIQPAKENQKDAILALYQTMLGGAADWDEDYPSMETIEFDMERGNLFVMMEGEELLAAISIDEDKEVEQLQNWSKNLKPAGELSRLCVRKDKQNQGIARIMMEYAFAQLRSRGCKGVHILVREGHKIALQSYSHLGYQRKGRCKLFEKDFICLERAL